MRTQDLAFFLAAVAWIHGPAVPQDSRPATVPAARPVAAVQATEAAIRGGLRWLARHQDADGAWDPAGFLRHDPGAPEDGVGKTTDKISVTALSLLAFLGHGQAAPMSPFEPTTSRAAAWLRAQQGATGQIGDDTRDTLAAHGLATLALAELFAATREPALLPSVQRSVEFLQTCRNPYKVWGDAPRDGVNDTSVTGWMALALVAAKRVGCKVDKSALAYIQAWLDEVTDPRTGQCGYRQRGDGAARAEDARARCPALSPDALTALALLCRLELGQHPATNPVLMAAAGSILRNPPEWSADPVGADACAWSLATLALRRVGAPDLPDWCEALDTALAGRQRTEGPLAGSFDPVGPFGVHGGRVYQTALLTLCQQARAGSLKVLTGK